MLWWLLSRVVAVIMILVGVFLFIFFPGVPRHQEAGSKHKYTSFGLTGIVLGIILMIVGGFLLFSP